MPRQQHLFALTHWLVKAATWLSILLSTVLVLALAGVVVAAMNLDGNHLGIPAEIEGVARGAALEIAAAAVVAGLCCVVLVVFTFRAIEGIVDTAISGDPFVNENADRLARVGQAQRGRHRRGLAHHGERGRTARARLAVDGHDRQGGARRDLSCGYRRGRLRSMEAR